jgi:hypothetical protein
MCLGEEQVVSVSSKRWSPLMLVCTQEYGDEPPLFMDEEKQKAVRSFKSNGPSRQCRRWQLSCTENS